MSQSPSSAGPGGPAPESDDDVDYLATPAGQLPLDNSYAPTQALAAGSPPAQYSQAPSPQASYAQAPYALGGNAPGGYAPGATIPGAYGQVVPPKRRRTGLIVAAVLAVVLVLAGGGIAGYLLWEKDDTAPASAADPLAPDPAWAEGGHALWHEEFSDADDVIPAGTSFLTVKRKGAGATITNYPITDSEPAQQWRAEITKYAPYSGGVRGTYFLTGEQLIDLTTGEVSDTPWDSAMDVIGVVDNVMIVCSSSQCDGYAEDLTQKWTGARFNKSLESSLRPDLVLPGSPSFITPDGHTIINVETGETHKVKTTRHLNAMADGWATYDTARKKTILYSPTGEEEDAVSADNLNRMATTQRFAPTTGQMRPSKEQIKTWANNSDISWAVATTDDKHKGYDCFTVTLTESGSTIELVTDGACVTDDVYALATSGSAAFGLVGSPDRGFQIAGMWNTATGQEISLPSSTRRTPYYFVSPGRLITVKSNEVTLYAAGAK